QLDVSNTWAEHVRIVDGVFRNLVANRRHFNRFVHARTNHLNLHSRTARAFEPGDDLVKVHALSRFTINLTYYVAYTKTNLLSRRYKKWRGNNCHFTEAGGDGDSEAIVFAALVLPQ